MNKTTFDQIIELDDINIDVLDYISKDELYIIIKQFINADNCLNCQFHNIDDNLLGCTRTNQDSNKYPHNCPNK